MRKRLCKRYVYTSRFRSRTFLATYIRREEREKLDGGESLFPPLKYGKGDSFAFLVAFPRVERKARISKWDSSFLFVGLIYMQLFCEYQGLWTFMM